tara:strand:+ start:154 stop:636 length:483 start_codon:yes stop_codon:yes gene_type:complete
MTELDVSVFRVVLDLSSFQTYPEPFISHALASKISWLAATVRTECKVLVRLCHNKRVAVTTGDRRAVWIGVIQQLKVDVDITVPPSSRVKVCLLDANDPSTSSAWNLKLFITAVSIAIRSPVGASDMNDITQLPSMLVVIIATEVGSVPIFLYVWHVASL